jgi:hypothetical protein
MDDTMSFDASLPAAYADNWHKAERTDTVGNPRLTSYQAPVGSPCVFILERFDFSGGQSVDTAEYPFGGLWSNEPLNEKPQVLHIQGFIHGPEYIKDRNTLINSLRVSTSDDTPGIIDLPFWGRFPVVVIEYKIAEKTDEKGQCSVSLDCKRAGISPIARTEAEEEARSTTTPKAAAEALQEAAIATFEMKLEDTLVQGFAGLKAALLTVLGRIQAAQTLLNTITNEINGISSLIAQGICAPGELARAFFNAIASIFGGLLEIKNSFDFYSVSRGGSGYPAPENNNEKKVLMQCLAARTYTLNTQDATVHQKNTKEAIEQCYRIGALTLASQILTQMGGTISYQKAQGYWNLLQQLQASIDQDNPVVYAAIEELRISVSQELSIMELSVEIHRTFMIPLPLLVMAQYLSCDEDKLRELNRVADSLVIKGEVVYV